MRRSRFIGEITADLVRAGALDEAAEAIPDIGTTNSAPTTPWSVVGVSRPLLARAAVAGTDADRVARRVQ